MQIHQGIENFPPIKNAIVTSGTFDGVHLGHQKILKRIQEIAQKQDGETVLITFWPHPRLVLQKDAHNLQLLSTIDEKATLLSSLGINHLLIIPFTPEFSELSPEEYVQEIYIKTVNTKCLVIGYDHHFGKNRTGNFEYLQENIEQYGFIIEEIQRHDIENIGVSSSKIRKALLAGKVQEASQYLGRNYSILGKVIHGDKIGRTIGFPTANIEVSESYKLIPKEGIYAVIVEVQYQKYQGMLYIGKRPTLEGKEHKIRIEVNILDFAQDIYEQKTKIEFIAKIREDIKFEGLEAMQQQLAEDEKNTRDIFNKLKHSSD